MKQNAAAKKERQLNYELLRILAMLMIVCLHYLGKGGLLGDPAADLTAVGYAAWLLEALCLVAVNAYVLISGYFGVGEARQTGGGAKAALKRLYNIWKQVLFYSLAIGFAAFLLTGRAPDLYQGFTYLFPIVTEHYWFVTSYAILCLLMPFLNTGLAQLDKRGLQYLIGGLLAVFSISKTAIPMQLPWDHYGYDAFWFIVLYLTGAYIRRFGAGWIQKRRQAVLLYLGSEFVIFASFLVLRTVFFRTGKLEDLINYGYTYNYLFCYLGAIGLFLAFADFGGKKGIFSALERFRKPIELLSGSAFGVYLIHEHIDLRSQWRIWFRCEAQRDNSIGGFLLHMAATVLTVYLVCTFIEIARKKAAEILFDRRSHKAYSNQAIYIPALILLLYPLRHAATGLDLMDAGYALGNYQYFDSMNQTWKLATYLANVLGGALTRLPFGGTWVGMNVYTSLLIGITAAIVFLFFFYRYGKPAVEKNGRGAFRQGCLLFAAELAAVSLCWAPSVILYHYLGYILMTAASLILFCGIVKDNVKYEFAAGVILGLCVAVRMPNITYMALIVPLWHYIFLKRKTIPAGQTWFGRLVNRTLVCMAGYFGGLAAVMVWIGARYGFAAYPKMVASLFGMTETATDYKPTSMIAAMFGDYRRYSAWLILFLAYMAAGFGLFWLLRIVLKKLKEKESRITDGIIKIFRILYIMGLFAVLRLCYGKGMFDFDYTAYFSMYKWVTVYLLLTMALCVWHLACRSVPDELKLWAAFLLVIIIITPLGSNNGLYPIINNLFLTAPASLLLAAEAFRHVKALKEPFVFRFVVAFVFACTAAQSILFGIGFVFHDALPPGEERVALRLQSAQRADGIKTAKAKKEQLEALDRFLSENGLTAHRLILFGNIPALAYLFDMEPAVFTTWADLDSNALERLQADLAKLEEAGEAPVIIFGMESVSMIDEKDETSAVRRKKLLAIREFMQKKGYSEAYKGEAYAVYCAD